MNNHSGIWLYVTASFLITCFATADVILETDPIGLETDINTLGHTMSNVVGNYAIEEFNNEEKVFARTFTFEETDGYLSATNEDQIGSITLNAATSGIDIVVTLDPGDPWGRINSSYFPTGGTNDINYPSSSPAVIHFNPTVHGVGATLNRLLSTATVAVHSVTSQIGTDYVIPANGTNGHSFFGFCDLTNSIVERIEITHGGGGQYSLDDLTVITEIYPPPGMVIVVR